MHQPLIAGVDEVGRGPLVGPVVTAAVILDPNKPIEGLADSKKLTEKKREALYHWICQDALAYSIALCMPDEIDQYNILQASLIAMHRAVVTLPIQPDHVLVDGNRCPKWDYSSEAIVKGDSKVAEISAASILAKVVRDQMMLDLDAKHPKYGFAKHKGYPTKAHFEAIERYGVFDAYRKSFGPVKRCLQVATN